jgi:hypothetical protein
VWDPWAGDQESEGRNRVAETMKRFVAQTVGLGVSPYMAYMGSIKAECSLAASQTARMKHGTLLEGSVDLYEGRPLMLCG